MKTKELIRRLQEADPTGELEACVGNADVFFVSTEPAYYDGCLQVLIRDPAKAPYYDVVGARYVSAGSKVKIVPLSITDLLWDDHDAFVDYSGMEGDSRRDKYRHADDTTRRASRDCVLKVDMDAFRQWVTDHAKRLHPDPIDHHLADDFYRTHLSPSDPVLPIEPERKIINGRTYESWPSWHDRRAATWDAKLEVVWWNGAFTIRTKAYQ